MDEWPRVRDDVPANASYDFVAEAYDTWMPYTAPYFDDAYFRRAIERGAVPALEIACGTGRLLVRYALAGFDVEGVDNSPEMLAVCARNAADAGVELTLHSADVTTLALDRKYATIYNPAGSFSLHDERDVAERALARWRDHLLPGGKLYVSMGVPRADFDANYEWRIRRSATRADGITFMTHEAVQCDVDAQRETIINRHERYDANGALIDTHIRRAQLRWWERDQLEAAFTACGLRDVHSDGIADSFVTVGAAPS